MHYLALTFKHAVEFSSFGCTPCGNPSTSAWGNSTYFIGAYSPESNPTFGLPFVVTLRPLTYVGLVFEQLLYSIQVLDRSQTDLVPRLPSNVPARAVPFSGNLPYSTRPHVQVKDFGCAAVTLLRFAPSSCRRVPERAGAKVARCGWVPLGSAAARFYFPAASRTPQGLENITLVSPWSQTEPAVTVVFGMSTRDGSFRAAGARPLPRCACPDG